MHAYHLRVWVGSKKLQKKPTSIVRLLRTCLFTSFYENSILGQSEDTKEFLCLHVRMNAHGIKHAMTLSYTLHTGASMDTYTNHVQYATCDVLCIYCHTLNIDTSSLSIFASGLQPIQRKQFNSDGFFLIKKEKLFRLTDLSIYFLLKHS